MVRSDLMQSKSRSTSEIKSVAQFRQQYPLCGVGSMLVIGDVESAVIRAEGVAKKQVEIDGVPVEAALKKAADEQIPMQKVRRPQQQDALHLIQLAGGEILPDRFRTRVQKEPFP